MNMIAYLPSLIRVKTVCNGYQQTKGKGAGICMINSCLASVDFWKLLIALANSSDPDQDGRMRS